VAIEVVAAHLVRLAAGREPLPKGFDEWFQQHPDLGTCIERPASKTQGTLGF
jgi:hypothetical protein